MERTRGFSTLTKRFDDVFPRFARRGVAAPTALLRGKGGILFPKRIPPLDPPEKGEGSPPSTPALRDLGLKDCPACGIRCLPSDVSKRFGLLLLPAAALPAIRQSSAISVYFGFYRPCRCLPRRHCFARRVCLHYWQKVVELRSLRYALPKMPAPSTEGN